MDILPTPLSAFYPYKQFVLMKTEPNEKDATKLNKCPVDHETGKFKINAFDEKNQQEFHTIAQMVDRLGPRYYVGFVISKKDPFFFIDLDNVFDSYTQKIKPIITEILGHFKGCAVEFSCSQKGLHIFGKGDVQEHSNKVGVGDISIELYTCDRIATLTGNQSYGDATKEAMEGLHWLLSTFFKGEKAEKKISHDWTTEPVSDWNGPADDEALIASALRSYSARAFLNGKANFRDLWEANPETLAQSYPDPARAIGYDESSADMALAQHLAFWTGKNCERILSLMKKSSLSREKWAREDYLRLTILKACSLQKMVYCKAQSVPDLPEGKRNTTVKRKEGSNIMTIEEQISHFDGCVYVIDENKIYVPGLGLLDSSRFKSSMGGRLFIMDNSNNKVRSNAWEIATESQAIQIERVHTTCFKPQLPSLAIIPYEGLQALNIYVPVEIKSEPGDCSIFLEHLRKLFPSDADFNFMLNYAAALVQMKGIKFQFCPVIQGVDGNGKTILSDIIAHAVGFRYCHSPNPTDITNRFNDWLYGKIFIKIDDFCRDVYSDKQAHKQMESMKVMFTNQFQEIQSKFGPKLTKEICANFILNSNHKDAVRKTVNDRRFAVFYTPQQSAHDIQACGMTGQYFSRLHNWLNNGGYAHVTHMLNTHPIPNSFRDLVMGRAVATTSTPEAITLNRSYLEQLVLEAIEQEEIGFKDGWVSSFYLNMLFERNARAINVSYTRRRMIMQSLGYDYHPKLSEGRVSRAVYPDGIKSRLYVKKDHPNEKIINPREIEEAYTKAQTPVVK